MPVDVPPSIDAAAAALWDSRRHGGTPWLHEEVARRMAERLAWIRLVPSAWVDWRPARGGLEGHRTVSARYPKAQAFVVESAADLALTRQALTPGWRSRLPWAASPVRFEAPAPGTAHMVWANMSLHMAADPGAWLAQWHDWLAVDGFLMFSCLGPDTLREVRSAYAELGWPEPAHAFTDMHDWGDMLIQAGFAEPVMDMERITLTFDSAERMLAELRGLGRNLAMQRSRAVRGRNWRSALLAALDRASVASPQRHALSFEVIYGHALRPRPRAAVREQTHVSLAQMRDMLRGEGR
jgi:malonyl-CoA O-methyltransferase